MPQRKMSISDEEEGMRKPKNYSDKNKKRHVKKGAH